MASTTDRGTWRACDAVCIEDANEELLASTVWREERRASAGRMHSRPRRLRIAATLAKDRAEASVFERVVMPRAIPHTPAFRPAAAGNPATLKNAAGGGRVTSS